ncbi:MAG: MBL fold metallo-hydrolase RNA specificity domain-containing protein [Chloroflexota bacterium]
MLSLTFYGGVRQIGGNKILLEDADTRLFLDFGLPYGDRGKYFEEYLNPRGSAGLLDFLHMGLLPPLKGAYRRDLETSNDFWKSFESHPLLRQLSVDGVLLSHAHLDHSGYISFLHGDIPVYSIAMTAFVAKAIQDSGRSDVESEVCYFTPKEYVRPKISDSVTDSVGGLQSGLWNKVAAKQRRFRLFDYDSLSQEAIAFWRETPGARKVDCCPLERAERVGNLEVRGFEVDHSIWGAAAFAIETSLGWVVYTGDLRLHGMRGRLTERFIEEAASLRPKLLLCEGTNIASPPSVREEEVYENALKVVKEANGLVIADFGPRNIERLIIFHRIAGETNRRLVVMARDAYLLKAMRLISPAVPDITDDPVTAIYHEGKTTLDRWERRIREEQWSILVTAEDINRDQSSYILCFSFFDINELPTIMPQEGGIYLYSSSEVFNEEGALDMRRLHNWIDYFKMKGIGLPVEVAPHHWEVPESEVGLHASGHASGPELVDLVRRISPEILIPVHTEKPELFTSNLEGSGVEVRFPEYGKAMTFED